MAIKSGMFNSVNRDRVYKAEDFASYFASFIGDGVFPNPSTGLQVTAGTGMNLILKPGRGWCKGYYLVNDADHTITLDTAEPVLKRIDRIVMQLNYLLRTMTIVVKKGVYASSPKPQDVVRNSDMYELVLADVLVNNGVVQINQGNITDQRLNSALCGIVHGTIHQVDTTTIFNQYQGWFDDYSVVKAAEFEAWQTQVTTAMEAWIDAQQQAYEAWRQAEEDLFELWSSNRKQAFEDWFETVRDILNTTADGNLLNYIDDHKNARMPHLFNVGETVYKWGAAWNPELNCMAFLFEED